MRNFTPLLSGLIFGSMSQIGQNKFDPQIGDDSNKEPPVTKSECWLKDYSHNIKIYFKLNSIKF